MEKKRFPVKRIALNAVLIALYIGLSFLTIPLGGLKITVEALPVIICAVAFGPVDAAIVGCLSELLNQMLTYGFTPTTLLWVLPAVVRGVFIGLCMLPVKKKLTPDRLFRGTGTVAFFAVCVVSGILVSCINTFTLYVDSNMYGYYTYAMVFGVFWIRIFTGAVSSVLMAAATVPIILALKRAKFIHLKEAPQMTAEQAIEYIHSVCWKGSVPGLGRTQKLLAAMGNPHNKLKYVHIAGTNGKGSTAAMTASILQKAGYRVGLYTSPYIYRFNERMQINGQPISDTELAQITAWIKPLAQAMEESPTEFELVSCIAFEYFMRNGCDIVVLEVGLGGALDSTNVIRAPEVAVITNIGLDHTDVLGSTVEEIARTKAGIFKEGGDAVVYRSTPSVEAVFEEVCIEKNVNLTFANFHGLRLISHGLEGQVFDCGERKTLELPLLGDHQLHNAAVVLSVADVLIERGWKISEENIYDGIREVSWPGRFDIMRRDPLFIIDGGHNPQCIEALVKNIEDYLTDRKVIVLTGVLADKDYADMYRPVMPLVEEFVCITPPSPRKLDAALLAQYLQQAGAKATACGSIPDGVRTAMEKAGKDGVVLSFGSLYSIGSIRDALEEVN